jgi:transposase-like protein
MNSVERGRSWLQQLREVAGRTAWAWRRCPYCGRSETWKHGTYTRRPWFLDGRQAVVVQRHWCRICRRTYAEQSALLVRGSWYAREVQRAALDQWQYLGSSLRRTAEWLRSWLGRQERWALWRPLDAPPPEALRCWLSASTVGRWLDRAGQVAETTVAAQLAGAAQSGQLGTDGLWAKLRGGTKRVVLGLMDSATGLLWPPVVVGDEGEAAWEALFARAKQAGLDLDGLRGVTSDGARGLGRYLVRGLSWVNHQRCVWHVWDHLGGELRAGAAEAAVDLVGAAATRQRRQMHRELGNLLRAVLDAASEGAATQALASLAAHPFGTRLAHLVAADLDALRIYRRPFNAGLLRVGPEWYWRDFRLRLSHGRNHGSPERLERAALVWAVARNFTPAQRRSERTRRYRAPGQSPLQRAGLAPEGIS